MNNNDIEVNFIQVKKIPSHFRALYKLLESRKFNISNLKLPSYGEHKLFVINHPYRAWYLIKANENFVGTIYLLKDNCVGIYVEEHNELVLRRAISWLLENKKPLSGIKSVRAQNFHINLAPGNKIFSKILVDMGATQIQVTYSLKNM